jgi:uncharacterized protein
MNRLANEKSPYLKKAAGQKISWYPWGEEAFETAKKEDKSVFLSTGAVWCHWCHVMAKECFENDEMAQLLNERFISVKLDRDERPDIDRRYQNAVSAMGFGGGWPLSVFLTPDRIPFFGGTYFPPEDAAGKPGFKKVLTAVADFYNGKKERAAEYGQRILDSLRLEPIPDGEIEEASIDRSVTNILSHLDLQNGGFGFAPKFPMPGAMELLINRYFFTKKESIGHAVKKTLESMGKGGFHDQIGGGFHRYSVDEAWLIPHFEKMTDDNAWHLRNYIEAYQVFGSGYFKTVAEGIVRFIKAVLSDPDGGFYASQDADVTSDDEGGYFTWTDKDFMKVLSDDEYRVLSLHLMNERGSMHHDESKKVLFVSMEAEEISGRTGMDVQVVSELIRGGKEKLLKERNARQSPFIDKTLYTSLNGMMISSCLKAFRALNDKELRDVSLKSLERMLNACFVGNELYHTEGVKAVLDDYIYLIEAFIAGYEVTGEDRYCNYADILMELCVERFWDQEGAGFFDTDSPVLGIRLKGIEDIPHPSANSLGIMLCLKLYALTEKQKYLLHAEKALRAFSRGTKEASISSGYYFCAMDAYFRMLKLTIGAAPHAEIAETALGTFYPYKSIVYGEQNGSVIPCRGKTCYEPLKDPASLKDFLKNL